MGLAHKKAVILPVDIPLVLKQWNRDAVREIQEPEAELKWSGSFEESWVLGTVVQSWVPSTIKELEKPQTDDEGFTTFEGSIKSKTQQPGRVTPWPLTMSAVGGSNDTGSASNIATA